MFYFNYISLCKNKLKVKCRLIIQVFFSDDRDIVEIVRKKVELENVKFDANFGCQAKM